MKFAFSVIALIGASFVTSHVAVLKGAEYELKPAGLEEGAYSGQVDINIGESPEDFVRSLHKQITGVIPSQDKVTSAAALLGTDKALRRIDLAIQVAAEAGVNPVWVYSDPWKSHPTLPPAPPRAVRRELGAVMMFFFTSPDAPNGGAGWANNHAPGMFIPEPGLFFEPQRDSSQSKVAGLYHPGNPGFWQRELGDARHAGLDFVLLNTYGPDINSENFGALNTALGRLRAEHGDNVVKIGLFDDTWTWGQPYFGKFWEQRPDCADPDAAAALIYEAKWRPFFQRVPRDRWQLVQGRPMIYFYNNNSLQSPEKLAPVLNRLRARFVGDFGVDPFICLDTGFNRNEEIRAAADAGFDWFTFRDPAGRSTKRWRDIELTHAMVRWDHISRNNDRRERVARADDMLHKDDGLLIRLLDATRDADILVLATWNDLGEGTGINRAYDYYWGGQWRRPDHFLKLMRRSQAGETLAP